MLDWSEKQLEDSSGAVLVELGGRLDALQADYLYSVLKKRIRDGQRRWILDLENVDFISSMGLGMLVRLNARVRKAQGEVKLARVGGLVGEALKITGLDRILQMYPSVEEAVDSWRAES